MSLLFGIPNNWVWIENGVLYYNLTEICYFISSRQSG